MKRFAVLFMTALAVLGMAGEVLAQEEQVAGMSSILERQISIGYSLGVIAVAIVIILIVVWVKNKRYDEAVRLQKLAVRRYDEVFRKQGSSIAYMQQQMLAARGYIKKLSLDKNNSVALLELLQARGLDIGAAIEEGNEAATERASASVARQLSGYPGKSGDGDGELELT